MIRYALIYLIAISLLATLPSASVFAQERHLRTYTLQRALAEQVAPILSAQLSPGSSVTPYRQQLILNVTDAEFQNLQALLAQLDTAPRSLLISVRKQSQQFDTDERYGVQGRLGDGAVQVQSGDGGYQRNQTRVSVNQSNAHSHRDGSQQVRAVEGMEAFISAGNTVSMRSGRYGERELVPVESGFYATARIVDDEVIVDIDQRDDRVQGSGVATQNLQTQLRGRIGEWIPLGGFNAAQAGSERTLTSYGNSSASGAADLAIKVDLLDR